jgi:antitoxin HicB
MLKPDAASGSRGFLKKISAMIQFMKVFTYKVILTPDESGGYVVSCPALPGLMTEGDTLKEARGMAEDAISGYLEILQKDGEPIPADEIIIETITVKLAE